MFNKEAELFYGVQWFQEANGRCHEFVDEFDSLDEQESFIAELLCQPNVWEIYSYTTKKVHWKKEGDRPEDFCYKII